MAPDPFPQPIAVGFGVSLTIGGLLLIASLWSPVNCLPLALLFFFTAFGIRRRIAWRAFGAALVTTALLGTAMVTMFRNRVPGVSPASLISGSLVLAGSAWIFWRAGRAIGRSGKNGVPAAWIALAGLVFVVPQVLQPYVMASGSMANTIQTGDYLLVRPATGSTVSRGDLVQFRYPLDPKQVWIKRVAAVGGDRIRFDHKTLILNGSRVPEPYVIHSTGYIDRFRDDFPASPNVQLPTAWAEYLRSHTERGELTVPQGKLFVLGDNRDDSLDSRYFGFINRSDVTGKPVLTYFSVQSPPNEKNPVLLHPSTIRWPRIFRTL